MRVNLEESFVLHARPFRDTSLLINIFSQNHGHLMLLARGARNQRSPLRALLLPFVPLLISWSGKTDLPIVSKIEPASTHFYLSGSVLLNGLYLNELLLRLLERYNPYPTLYTYYCETLLALTKAKNQKLPLRIFEKRLLAELGYGLQLHKEINGVEVNDREQYYFEFGQGLKKAFYPALERKNLFSGKSLLAIHEENLTAPNELQDAERLLQLAINALLSGRSLKSRELI